MPERADAHAHLFNPGFVDKLDERCRRVSPDEVTVYESLAKHHEVKQLLAVGFEGAEAYRGNNDYLASLAPRRAWLRPTAYFHEPRELTAAALEARAKQGFVGISLYLFSEALTDQLNQVKAEVWEWLLLRRWLLSVNSKGEHWRAWAPVLERHPDLRLVMSHLGLPGVISAARDAAPALASVSNLSRYPGVRVKLSGFYALSDPGYDYPHRNAWPLVERLVEDFGVGRLLWGSDFSPSLEHLSFPQTFALFSMMPFLNPADRSAIEGANLLQLLRDVR